LLTDPRQGAHEDDRVLQLVARRGRLTAKDTSQELGIPLRSAQAALEALLTSGACSRERNGRSIEYRVDDTTFQEPTDLGG
jgi:predicted ArsR family transcriptional regulator